MARILVTEEIAEEHGLKVDLAGFEAAMEAQRQRAKAAAVSIDLTLQGAIEQMAAELEHLTRDGKARHQLAENGLKTIRERHTCRHRAQELMSIYEEIRR